MQLAAGQLSTRAAAAAAGRAPRRAGPPGTPHCTPRLALKHSGTGLRLRAQGGGGSSEEGSTQEELDQHLSKLGPAAADLDPLEGHCEPPPADGEGPEYNMGDVTHHEELPRQTKASPSSSEGGGSSASPAPTAAGSGGAGMGAGGPAQAVGPVVGEGGAKQDGHYHYTPGEYGSLDQQKMNESWMCEEEPEALERSATAKHEPPHYEMYRGEADDSEGFKEPGQSIASALPRMGGEAEDYVFWGDDAEEGGAS